MRRRLLACLVVLMSLVLLTSCSGGCIKNSTRENDGSIHLVIGTNYLEYMDYDKIPDFTLNFEGIINTSTAITYPNMVAFAGNDDFVVSEIIAHLFSSYFGTERFHVQLVHKDTGVYLTKMNVRTDEGKQKQVELEPSDDTIYEEIAYLLLDNGLILSVEYRRFTSYQDKALKTTDTLHTYYVWRYADLLNMILHYPLMVVEENDGARSLWIVPLPLGVTYDLGATEHTSASTIIKKDKYVVRGAYTYPYPGFNDDPSSEAKITHEEQVELVKTFYETYFAGYMDSEHLYFSYLGKNFELTFGEREFTLYPVIAN